MRMLIAQEARLNGHELARRLTEIDHAIARLQRERTRVAAQLRPSSARAPRGPAVSCPRCGRDRDFLTDNGGYLGHVLEDPTDTEGLEPGKPLFCPSCGDVFLYLRVGGSQRARRKAQ